MPQHSQRDKSAGTAQAKRFVPATLFPYGGFGDLHIDEPYTRVPRGVDRDSALQAVAQDRLAREVRRALTNSGMTEAELEKQLGYRRYGLVRKLNGNEQMTMRDVARLATMFDATTIGAIAGSPTRTGHLVQEEPTRTKAPETTKDLIADAALKLKEAARLADAIDKNVLENLAETVLAIGKRYRGKSQRNTKSHKARI